MDSPLAAAARVEPAGRRSLVLPCDVRQPEQVAAAVEEMVTGFGRIDVLVNAAAGNFRCPAAELSPNAWRTVIDTDLNGTFFCSQAAAAAMRAAGGGVIVNITGDFTGTHGDRMGHAAAAKAGSDSLTRSLAKEWGRMEEIVAAAVFLASDAAAFITGATLVVDGGYSWSGYDLP